MRAALAASVAALLQAPAIGSAQVTIHATGIAADDMAAVQSAVDAGGDIVLTGTFNFHTAPVAGLTLPTTAVPQVRTITVTRAVHVSGPATILGGTVPFFVVAPDAAVSFKGLRFVQSKLTSILINSAAGLLVEDCDFEKAIPIVSTSAPNQGSVGHGVLINPPLVPPPFNPRFVRGNLVVKNSRFDLEGAPASARTSAVNMVSGGVEGNGVTVTVSGNTIKNTTGQAIIVENIAGDALIDGNHTTSGPVVGTTVQIPAAIAIGSGGLTTATGGYPATGRFTIERNTIVYEGHTGAGIYVGHELGTIVKNNDVTMVAPPPPPGVAEVTLTSSGIRVASTAKQNVVLQNRFRGKAGYALRLTQATTGPQVFRGSPADTTLVGNSHDALTATRASVLIESGSVGTVIVGGGGTIQDDGTTTVVKGSYVTVSGADYNSSGGVGQDVSEAEHAWTW